MNLNGIFHMIQITVIPICSNSNSNGINHIKIALIHKTALLESKKHAPTMCIYIMSVWK
jgi:hypothetical protein